MKSSTQNQPEARYYTDTQDRLIASVPLCNGRGIVRLLASHYRSLLALGVKGWYANDNGSGRAYVIVIGLHGNTAHDGAARLIAGAITGQRVSYLDGNSFNLLPENLWLTEAVKGKERASTDHRRVMRMANFLSGLEGNDVGGWL